MTSTFTRNPRTLLEQQRNLIGNPRMGVDTSGWSAAAASGTHTLDRPPVAGAPSGWAARITLASTTTNWNIRRTLAVEAGKTYTFSAYMRPTLNVQTRVVMGWLDSVGGFISEVASPATAHVANTWARRNLTAVAPAGTASVRVEGRVVDSAPAGSVMNLTAAMLEGSAWLSDYFDGATPDAGGHYYRWTGPADNSPSTDNILNPADVTTPLQVNGYESSATARTTAHQVVNSAQVVVAVAPASPRKGSFELLYDDVVEAMTAEAMFREGGLFTFADDEVPEVGMTFAPAEGAIQVSQDETRSLWLVKTPYIEVV